jgi:prophage regulatory protein
LEFRPLKPQSNAAASSFHILRPREVFRRVSLSRTTVYQQVRAGTFPRPLKLTPKATGWLEHEIDQWIGARVAERDRQQHRPTPPAQAA